MTMMAAENLYDGQRTDNNSTQHNNSDVPDQSWSAAFSQPPSALGTMNPSMMLTSSGPASHSMNTYSEYGDDNTMWNQHAMDFSNMGAQTGLSPWSWANQQMGNFDVRNGLTTPPKDNSPQTSNTTSTNPDDTIKQKKRGRKSSKAGGETSANNPLGRKARKKSNTSVHEEDEDEGEGEEGIEGEDKREKFLERNRVAASKCRQKKKAWTNNLEQRARQLTSERQMLTTHVAMLRNELLELKCKCLEHTNCDCEQIRQYLKNTVAALQPAQANLYQFSEQEMGRRSSSGVGSNDATSPQQYMGSQASSPQDNSHLDYLKLEDDMRSSLSQSFDPTREMNGLKN